MAQNSQHPRKERSEPSKNGRWLKTQNGRQVAENSQNGRLQFVSKKSAPHPCSKAGSHIDQHGTDKIKTQHSKRGAGPASDIKIKKQWS